MMSLQAGSKLLAKCCIPCSVDITDVDITGTATVRAAPLSHVVSLPCLSAPSAAKSRQSGQHVTLPERSTRKGH